MSENRCIKCGEPTVAGYVAESPTPLDLTLPSVWVVGQPEDRRVLGASLGKSTEGKAMLPISGVRCVKCGYLELFARQP